MRGLFVVNNPVFGGGQGQLLRLHAPLAARGWDFVAVTPHGAEASARLRAGGVPVKELRLHRLRASLDPRVQMPFLAGYAREVAALRRLIRSEQIDLVQVHGDTNAHAAIAAHLEGVAVVWQIYDTRTPRALRRVTMPLVTRLADVITTWGERLGHEYPGTTSLGDRWITVFPPVDGEEFASDPRRRAAARSELGIKDGDLAVAVVGMLNPSKGHDHFVRALALARQEQPRLVGRILGPSSPAHGDYERRVREEAERQGLLADGALTIRDAGSRMPALLPGFDMLALSSVPRSEGMPTVILEAMACGIPVVATNVGAVSELVADGHSGLVVAPGDDRAFAAALRRLGDDSDLRRRMGRVGRLRFAERFQIERLADRNAAAYELAVEHRRARRGRRS